MFIVDHALAVSQLIVDKFPLHLLVHIVIFVCAWLPLILLLLAMTLLWYWGPVSLNQYWITCY